MKKGLLIIVSGPSGVGKGTVLKKVMDDPKLNLVFSISMTTRSIRDHEVDGVNYFFVSPEKFQQVVDADGFLENVEFVGHRYGTPKAYVEKLRREGKNVVLEIEVEGAKQVMARVKDHRVMSFFIIPPSLEELKHRILGRKTESEEVINLRLNKAEKELAEKFLYQHIILNDDPERAAKEMRSIIQSKINARIIG